jgi:cell division septum initiation protein DivIVA
MRIPFSPGSFLLGLATAAVVPLIARTARPLAVQATATVLDAFEEAQRIVSEQKERWEDIVAEAKVQREVALEAPRRRKRVRRTHQQPPDTSGDQPARTTADGSAERSA